jgi:ParB family chromosome partitioning protein
MAILELKPIPLERIDISRFNVRTTSPDEGIDELAESIELIGLQQPVVVFRKNDRYELIIGQRRYLAHKKLRRETILALIAEPEDETGAALMSFSENIHRRELAYRDKEQVAVRLLKKIGSVEKVASRLGVTPQTVRNYLGYSIVPEPIKDMVAEGKFGADTATRIARAIPDEDKAIKIAERIGEIRRSEDRLRVIHVARQNPQAPPEDVFKIAERTKSVRLTIHLTPPVAEALDRASHHYQTDRETVAVQAVEQWLADRGFD